MRTLQEEVQAQGFSLKVTFRDEKSGVVVDKDPYTLHVVDRARYWERPVGSGNLFDKKGQPVGRWDASKPEGKRFLKGEPHIAFERPLTQDQKLARDLVEKDARIEALQKELSLIKGEAAPKAPAKK